MWYIYSLLETLRSACFQSTHLSCFQMDITISRCLLTSIGISLVTHHCFTFIVEIPIPVTMDLTLNQTPGSPPVMPCNKVHEGTILGLLPSGPIYEISIAIFRPYLPVGSGGLQWPVITLLLAIPTGWEDLFPESCVIKIYPKIYVCGEDWVWGLNSHLNLFLHTIHYLN